MTNVKDFGAAGDGTVDDAAAIQHAVDQGDGHIVLPRGVYRLSRPIDVELRRHGVTAIEGQGGLARLVMAGPGPALNIVGTHGQNAEPKNVGPAIWQRERMPTVSGLEIEGAHAEADGIALRGTVQATIAGVLIRRCRHGIRLVERNRNVLVADSHIYDGRGAAIGIYFDGVNLHQANIVGCHISYCGHAGIKLARSEVRNLQITGCDIEYNFDPALTDSADVWIDAREGTVREGTIASCTIQAKESPAGANVRIEGTALDAASAAGLWTITGNVLQSQAVNVLLRYCRGITVTGNSFASGFQRSLVLDHCRHVVIAANTFDHNPDYTGNRIDGILVRDSAGINLTGLILEDSRAGSAEAGGAIEVRDAREVSVTGCQVIDPAHRGIDLVNVRHCRVSDCTVLERRPERTMREAIRLTGSGRGNVVQNNLLGRGTGGALAVAENAATVAGNVVLES